MILPENQHERDYAYAVAALGLRARTQDDAGDTEGAIVLSSARRSLVARGLELHGARNVGLVEFAQVLADQDDKPDAFITFLAKQDEVLAAAREAKREKVAEPDPAPKVMDVAPEPEPEPIAEKKPAPRRRRTKKES